MTASSARLGSCDPQSLCSNQSKPTSPIQTKIHKPPPPTHTKTHDVAAQRPQEPTPIHTETHQDCLPTLPHRRIDHDRENKGT